MHIRGRPEVTQQEDFLPTVTSIFNTLLGRPDTNLIDIDWVHRIPGALNPAATQPQNVLCRFCFFKQKDAILSKAWKKGIVDFDNDQLTLYPDLLKLTLAKRRVPHLLTPALQEAGLTYRWGYPFHLQTKKKWPLLCFPHSCGAPDLY